VGYLKLGYGLPSRYDSAMAIMKRAGLLRGTTDPKNLKISQCYVTMTYNPQYFFRKIGEVPRQKIEIPWNGPQV
jgi:hypothetical protein